LVVEWARWDAERAITEAITALLEVATERNMDNRLEPGLP
jgi:hypothetical protein